MNEAIIDDDANLPVHPRQVLRIQRSLAKQKASSKSIPNKNTAVVETDDHFEDAMDEEAISKAERTKLWNPQVWDSAISGNIQNLLILAARGWRCDIPHPRSGITPLWAAAENGKENVVKFLLETMGVDVNARADDGSTPLFAAAQNGHLNVMILLLSDWDCGSADVNLTRISDGATPLYVACQRAHLSCIRLLLLKGANINHKRKGGYTPLWTACDLGHQGVIDILVSDIKCDLSMPNDLGIKPSTAARKAGHKNLSRYIDSMAKRQLLLLNEKNSSGSMMMDKKYIGKDDNIELMDDSKADNMKKTSMLKKNKVAFVPEVLSKEKGKSIVGVDNGGDDDVDDYDLFINKQLNPLKKHEWNDASEINKESKETSSLIKNIIKEEEEEVGEVSIEKKDEEIENIHVERKNIDQKQHVINKQNVSTQSMKKVKENHINSDKVEKTLPPPQPPSSTTSSTTTSSSSSSSSSTSTSTSSTSTTSGLSFIKSVGPGEESSDHSLFVYSKDLKRNWSWEAYIRQSSLHTHNICKCVHASIFSSQIQKEENEKEEKEENQQGQGFRKHEEECGWRKRVNQLRGFNGGYSIPQISVGLFDQVEALHKFVALKSPDCNITDSSSSSSLTLNNHKQLLKKSKLYLNQCIFTEGRGLETQRVHTLELRLGYIRPKKSKDWFRYKDPCLVSPNEVVLLLGIPLRFPQDSRVRIHCMQGYSRIPSSLIKQTCKKKNKIKSKSKSTTNDDGKKDDKMNDIPISEVRPFRPGDTISFTFMTEQMWKGEGDNNSYSLIQFVTDLFNNIEAKGGNCGGLLPPPTRFIFNSDYADALLLKNEKAAAESEASRIARLTVPLSKKDKRARIIAALGLAVQIALFFFLVVLKNRGV